MAGLPDIPFHDAEILAMRLNRDGPTLDLDIEIFAQLPEAEIVQLRFTDVTELDIGGFNEQNVLFDLLAEPGEEGQLHVEMESSYGLSGTFRCSSVTRLG